MVEVAPTVMNMEAAPFLGHVDEGSERFGARPVVVNEPALTDSS